MFFSEKLALPLHPVPLLLMLSLVGLFCVTPCVHAQPSTQAEVMSPAVLKAQLLYGPTPASPSAPPYVERVIAAEISNVRLVMGGSGGYGLGLLAGGFVGHLISSDAEESWIGPEEMFIGGILGSSAGAPLGVYFSNRHQGNLLLMMAASGLPLLIPVVFQSPVVLLLVPLTQITASVGVARFTS